MEQVPASLKGAGLTLSQANDWARYYDSAKKQEGVQEPAGVAWKIFKQKYKKVGDEWVMKSSTAKPWEAEEKKEGTMRHIYGRKRDEIAKRLFGKMFNELTDEQKAKVHNEAVEHSMDIGIGDIVFNAIENDICKFSFIVQTEGIHQGVSGNKVMYTRDLFDEYGRSMVGNDVSDDPAHLDNVEGYRKLGSNFANIVDTEVAQINADMVDKFGINPTLVGKWALIAHAEGYKSDYNYLLRNNKIRYYSSELSFSGKQDKDGVWHPDYINYDGMVALSNPGADPGAIMLGVYNTKYGGIRMGDEDIAKVKEELETQKALNTELQEKIGSETELSEKYAELETSKKEMEAKNAELEGKVKELNKGEFDLDQAKEKIDELNTKNKELGEKVSVVEESSKEIESLNAKIKGMRDEKRKEVLSKETSNEDIIKSVIDSDLDDEAFNAKIVEIKALKEEATKESQASGAGIVSIESYTKPDEFKKEWNMSKEDVVKEITGGIAE